MAFIVLFFTVSALLPGVCVCVAEMFTRASDVHHPNLPVKTVLPPLPLHATGSLSKNNSGACGGLAEEVWLLTCQTQRDDFVGVHFFF